MTNTRSHSKAVQVSIQPTRYVTVGHGYVRNPEDDLVSYEQYTAYVTDKRIKFDNLSRSQSVTFPVEVVEKFVEAAKAMPAE